jgi:hypothetical protein
VGVSKRLVIYVCGVAHSGSTLVGCVLGANALGPYVYFHVGECHAFFDRTHRNFGTPRAASRRRIYHVGGNFWERVDPAVGPEGAYAEIFEKSGAEVLIDSSKQLDWGAVQADVCRRLGFEFVAIVTMRSFVHLVHSAMKRGASKESAIDALRYYIRLTEFLRQARPRKVVGVDTQIFCTSPAKYLMRLCRIVEIPFFEGKELYWIYPHMHLYGSRIQRQHASGRGGYQVSAIPNDFDVPDVQRALRSRGLLGVERELRRSLFI